MQQLAAWKRFACITLFIRSLLEALLFVEDLVRISDLIRNSRTMHIVLINYGVKFGIVFDDNRLLKLLKVGFQCFLMVEFGVVPMSSKLWRWVLPASL